MTGAHGTFGSVSRQRRCLDFNMAMTQAIERLQPRLVILTAYWGFPDAYPEPLPSLGGTPGDPVFSRALEDALARITTSGRHVCLVRDVPIFPYDVAHSLAMAHRRGIKPDFNRMTRAQAIAQQSIYDAQFDRLEPRGLFHSISLREVLCDSGECRMQDDEGAPLYSDTQHLTLAGARFVEGEVEKCFD